MDVLELNIHQVFVKLLDGKHTVLNFVDPSISVSAVKRRIETLTSIPSHLQLLVLDNSSILDDDRVLNIARSVEKSPLPDSSFQSSKFPIILHLLLRLRGGKGGFGSLLRGAATKAGHKKTNNFDACRDMNGRRLRHVNAEKRLEEWRAEAEDRKLEKMAEEFIKKKGKESGKSGKSKAGDNAEKYVAKYREDSAKCMEEVERSVRESIQGLMGSKRKNLAVGSESAASKRLKIWLGKRELSDSDSEDLDEEDNDREEDEEENEKSVIIDNGSHSDSSKEAETSAGSITDEKFVAESVDQGSSESGPDELENAPVESLTSDKSTDGESMNNQPLEENTGHNKLKEEVHSAEGKASMAEPIHEESPSVITAPQSSEKPLNIDEYNSASDLEVFGMERLKSELQARGLKCGGTLQERAARLFLLKTTPLEKLPKKLFAKK